MNAKMVICQGNSELSIYDNIFQVEKFGRMFKSFDPIRQKRTFKRHAFRIVSTPAFRALKYAFCIVLGVLTHRLLF